MSGLVLARRRADGAVEVEATGPVAEDAVFELGSVTKAVTGLLLADAVVRGEVALDTPLTDCLPGARPRAPITLGGIDAACQLARSLEPAMVVLEDVDLIAQDRSHYESAPLLFELLNAMDGLEEDADIVFVLTSNRPETLEPALAARPGRIDLAVELPLPDAAARRRLFELYGRGLALEVPDWEPVVAATDGTSPAFIRELFRHAALSVAEDGRAAVSAVDLMAAVSELKEQSGRLTAALLGAGPG